MSEVIPRRLRAVKEAEPTNDPASWLVRAGRGDEGAFAQLYDEFAGLVFGVAVRVIRDRQMAEEVAQEVFVDVWRLACRFDPDRGSARSWVATIAHRKAVDRVRSEQTRRTREENDGRRAIDSSSDIAETVTDRLDHKRVNEALDTLTERQREAVTLAYYGGRTYREVALLLDVPEGTIKTRIRDGLIRLRDEIGACA